MLYAADLLNRVIRYAIERQQTLRVVRHSEQRLRSIIEHTSDGVVIVSALLWLRGSWTGSGSLQMTVSNATQVTNDRGVEFQRQIKYRIAGGRVLT